MINQPNEQKQRVVAWLPPELIHSMDTIVYDQSMKNHTEFIAKAVDFYIGYLGCQNSTAFLSENLMNGIQRTLQAAENRTSTNLFRLAVETNMMMHLLATSLEITDGELIALRGRCIREVKQTKGKIQIDHAIEFQQSEF